MKYFFIIGLNLFLFINNGFSQEKTITHKVENDETIAEIAQKYHITPYDIYKLNPAVQSGIKQNMVLLIPSKMAVKGAVVSSTQESNPSKQTSISFVSHEVKLKETIYSVSNMYNLSADELIELNPELKQSGIQLGMLLKVPDIKKETSKPTLSNISGLSIYEVKENETLYSLAKSFNSSVEQLIELNPELNQKGIQKGIFLKVPLIKSNEIETKNKEITFKLDCFELNQSNKKPSEVMANLFMKKAHDVKTKLNSICKTNGYEIEEILYQNSRIGYRIEGNENVCILDNKGLLYLRILKEHSGGITYKYTYNYSGLVVSLDIETTNSSTSHSFKKGITKEQALDEHKNYNKIRVVSSPSNDKSYSSDGSKCISCGLGRYVRGSCSQCGAVSRARLNESQSRQPNCEACSGKGFVSGYNGKRLCKICKGSGKLTY